MESKFSIELSGNIAKLTLVGRLDATNAAVFQEELKKISGQQVTKVVFFAKDLEYIASAGLRVMIFAKQKLCQDAQVYLVGAQEAVLNVVKMSGLDTFMAIQDTFQE
ncbi:MAG: STAS domain-containing protein [Candidatus Omnitrophica bacterium]|nr:STAS domain-containing protein [Candidatus Omnitrophota bacterium]